MLRDTTPAAEAFWIGRLRSMTPQEKLAQVFRQIESGRRIVRSGVRARMPGATEAEIARETVRLLYGAAAARLL
jgi:hypothetical protein